jgi:ABC-type Mn2+/Zn2+ transport system ATPase subunit
LDIRSEEAIFPLLDRLSQRGITILISTHDLNQAAEKFEQVILLNRIILGFGSPQEVFTTELLLRAYGGHLHLMKSTNGMVVVGDTCCDEAGLV